MSTSNTERGSRGQYARLLCQRCRSRKIKCNIPNINDLGPLDSPQTTEKSCERCRTLGLDCVIKRSTLGRPSFRRSESRTAQKSHSARCHPNAHDAEFDLSSSSQAKGHQILDSTISPATTEAIRAVADKTVFENVIEFQDFFASALGRDRVFGATIPRSTPGCIVPLPELVSQDLAISLDYNLSWPKLFIPRLPSLSDVRRRLTADDALNISTNLLFALLCLISCDTTSSFDRLHPRLRYNLQLAISSYGQEFIFSPPTHCDSIVVCLLLADYMPTAMAVSQQTAHRSIRSTLYINTAFRIAEKLEMLPSQSNLSFPDIPTVSNEEFEHQITGSLQGMKIFIQDIVVDGLLSKPTHLLQEALDRMAPHIDVYENIFKHRPCSPKIVFQTQWAIASYILLDSLKAIKLNWTNPQRLCHIIDGAERKCLEQIKFCDQALSRDVQSGSVEEVSAACSLLKYRFHAVTGRLYGIALLYIIILRSRTSDGSHSWDSDIDPQEAKQMGAKLANALSNASDDVGIQIINFLSRFGHPYADQLLAALELFIGCSDLKIDGVVFQAPFRDIVLDVLVFSRSIVENYSINAKNLQGSMRENGDRRISTLTKCAGRLCNMVASSKKSTEAAFAGGCVFAASAKIMMAFVEIMKKLKRENSSGGCDLVSLAASDMPIEGPSMSNHVDDSGCLTSLGFPEPLSACFGTDGFVLDWSAVDDFDFTMIDNGLDSEHFVSDQNTCP